MKIESEKLVQGRKIVTGSQYSRAVSESLFSVFIGVFNGSRYLESLLEQISNQSIKGFPLIIVDNRSTDDSWAQILAWPAEVRNRSKLIRNPINVGAHGSLALNFREIDTEWYITLHQDDSYGPSHLSVLGEAIRVSPNSEIVIFTDMGTQNMDGKKILTPIRQSWIANLETPASTFRANLLQQSISTPSAAFRVSGISEINIPWHSSSFPDTEITLLQASMGSSRFLPELTMLYRMNPKSDSHDLNPRERVLGPFASLSRVMASDSFLRLCRGVREEERNSFAKAVLEGIETRLGRSAFSEMVKLIASETMGLAWDYSENISRDQIHRTYMIAEDGRTTKLLEELGAFYSDYSRSSKVEGEIGSSPGQAHLVQLLDEAAPRSNTQAKGLERALLNSLSRILPLRLRRKILSFLIRLYSRFDPKSPWNLSWKPKS
jgi:glycosyltransferase involved in cell wall biosynthesis